LSSASSGRENELGEKLLGASAPLDGGGSSMVLLEARMPPRKSNEREKKEKL